MEEYVSAEVIAKLLGETKPEITPPEVKHFQFVVILADDTYPQKAPAIISAVMGTPVEHRANVSNVTPLLFVALLGVSFPEGNSAEARRRLVVARILRRNDVIRRQLAFEIFSMWHFRKPLQVGDYCFDHPVDSREVFRQIAGGRIFVRTVTCAVPL
jgi:hypothetical protein